MPQQEPKVIRTNATLRIICGGIYAAGLWLLWARMPFNISDHYRVIVLPCYAMFGALWLADVFFSRIVLTADGMLIVSISDFERRFVPRADIERVTWEKGCGASIHLHDGTWVKLPSPGRDPQGLTNTIRAWLKKTVPSNE